MLNTTEQIVNEILILRIKDELNLTNAIALKDKIETYLKIGRNRMIFDLKEVSFLDSTGISGIIYCHKRIKEQNGKLVIVNSCENIGKIFKLTKLDSILKLSSTEDEALKSF